jgi:hypothetical protein
MNNLPTVLPIQLQTADEYDLAIATVGYESRSSYLAGHLKPIAKFKIAAGFKDRQVFHYATNRASYLSSGYVVQEVEDSKYRHWCADAIDRAKRGNDRPVKIWVDISSTTRFRMATIVECMRASKFPILVDFFYAIAKYSAPGLSKAPNIHVGPVTNTFAGWSDPDRSAVAIVGLGYEENKALGAVEHIQATDVWTFIPHSEICEYNEALAHANSILLDKIPDERRVAYLVERPFDCFVILESLVNRIADSQVPVLFPFGPKIFTLCALLVGSIHATRVAVWRVSAGPHDEATDRQPSGSICGLRVAFDERMHHHDVSSHEKGHTKVRWASATA